VRIADADRVRLGPPGVGNHGDARGLRELNAGTLASSMVEGRISAGVVVDDGTDIGGGASIMGTLSGGGSEVISVGKRCLLGANAVWGSHWATTASSRPVFMSRGHQGGDARPDGDEARTLSGTITFCSAEFVSGAVEVVARDGQGIALTRHCTPTSFPFPRAGTVVHFSVPDMHNTARSRF